MVTLACVLVAHAGFARRNYGRHMDVAGLVLCGHLGARAYPANVTRVVDGDTAVISMDLGLGLTLADHLRVIGVNAPEGKVSKATTYFESFAKRPNLKAHIVGRDKYGRLLGTLCQGERCIHTELLSQHLAVPYCP